MATDYERERQFNILRNKELLNGLSLVKKPPGRVSSGQRPQKRRKLEPAQPTRSSSRLSALAKPSYVETEVIIEPTPPKRPSRPKPLMVNQPQDIVQQWSWQATAELPVRDNAGGLHFDGFPDFQPNLTPEEILRQGAFGGSYYRPVFSKTLSLTIPPDYSDIPSQWLTNLPIELYLTSPIPIPSTNKFRVLCGQTIEEWEASGWIDYNYDPRGWFQWYSRFYQGRRCGDDARQIGRWRRCVGPTGRWRRTLLKRYKEKGIRDVDGDDAEEVSPVVHQTCHHWAYQITQEDLDEMWPAK